MIPRFGYIPTTPCSDYPRAIMRGAPFFRRPERRGPLQLKKNEGVLQAPLSKHFTFILALFILEANG